MDHTEKEVYYQEKLWSSHVTELSLTYNQAQLLVDLIIDQMNQGVSDDERITVHFTREGIMNSDKLEKYALDRITTILDCDLVTPQSNNYEVDRLVEAHRLVEYEALIRAIMK